jgi:Flp pilus assembly protein TadB
VPITNHHKSHQTSFTFISRKGPTGNDKNAMEVAIVVVVVVVVMVVVMVMVMVMLVVEVVQLLA